ncbi:heterogeneous nuclear ribonucleoprotein F [Carex littledalei]|uniref:Heterogeneous nuclear ribonucleoprotein F n=1 Tax=Carex littledalei TaxID=544730 RepID=A0A833QXZ1_9POAL|nr:heterogeneous nuclear ribonucleoprotein F [Carex littledalei]
MMYQKKRKYDGNDSRAMGLKRHQPYPMEASLYGAPAPGGMNMMYPAGPFGYSNQASLFPAVRLRGLPFDCSEVDVVDFLQGLDLIDILFVHNGGRFTGEAYCLLAYPVQVDFALQRNRQNIGRRYIEVFRCKREDYYTAIAQEVSSGKIGGSSPRRNAPPPKPKPSADGPKDDHAVHTGVLRMRGLPFSATKEEIMDFFREFELTENRIHLVLNRDGRPSGEAFVEFENAEESKAAMKNDRMTLGSRYIELFASQLKEMDEAISRERH